MHPKLGLIVGGSVLAACGGFLSEKPDASSSNGVDGSADVGYASNADGSSWNGADGSVDGGATYRPRTVGRGKPAADACR